jgi:hypothetical protein
LYANSDPVGGWDPSGQMTMVELVASVALSAAINVATTLVLYDWRDTSNLGRDVGIAAAAGALGGIVGGPLVAIFTRALRPWLRAAAGGAIGNGVTQLFGDAVIDFYFNRKPLTIEYPSFIPPLLDP